MAFGTLLTHAMISTAADIALIVVGLAILMVSLVLVNLAITFKRTLSKLSQDFGPISERARSISDNIEFITQALRTDVERLNESVKALNDRLHQASSHTEKRIEEFNALMEVVQGEAEGVFIKTAAAVRGVRQGAQALGKTSGGKTSTIDVNDRQKDTDDLDS